MNARSPANPRENHYQQFDDEDLTEIPNDLEIDFNGPLNDFFDNVFGPARGYVSLGFAHGPKVKEKGNKRPFMPRSYAWPEQRDDVNKEITRRQRDRWDVYFCPALQRDDSRSANNAAEIWTLSFELDQAPADASLLEKLDAIMLESGSRGEGYANVHVHLLLAEAVDADTADRLTETIAKAVAGYTPGSGVALKWEANALLRVPDTSNFKSYWANELPARRRAGGHARPVVVVKAQGKRWSLDELEALCASLASRGSVDEQSRVTPTLDVHLSSEVDLDAFPGVRRALHMWGEITDNEDERRSDAHRAVTRECYKARITQDSAIALLLAQAWCKGDEKWVNGDVHREYDKAAAEGVVQVPGDEFWDARPMLAHLREYATERLVPRWALLGHTLLRFAATIPPCYVLPPTIGAYGSLNLYIALIGPSAGGKTTSGDASQWAVPLPFEPKQAPLGTGQGMTRCYMTPGAEKPTYVTDSMIFKIDEVTKLKAYLSKADTTLLGELNTAWVGSTLGAANADPTKTAILSSHTYRLGLHVGVQPDYADVLLDHVGSGFPQRFLWFDAHLPSDVAWPTGKQLKQWKWVSPDVRKGPIRFDKAPDHFETIAVPEFVRKEVIQNYISRSQGHGDPLTGHRDLTRLKVAAVLMWMDGRCKAIDAEDWYLSGQILAHSDETRQAAQDYHTAQRAIKADAAAVRAGKRAVITDQAKEAEQVKRAKEKIIALLAGGPCVRSKLTGSGMSASLRGDIAQQALDELRRAKRVRARKKIDPLTGTTSLVFHLVRSKESD